MFSIMSKYYKLKLTLDLRVALFYKIVELTILNVCEIWGSVNAERLEMFWYAARDFVKQSILYVCCTVRRVEDIYIVEDNFIDKRMLNGWDCWKRNN